VPRPAVPLGDPRSPEGANPGARGPDGRAAGALIPGKSATALGQGDEEPPTQNVEEPTEAAPGLIPPCVVALDAWRLRNGPEPPISNVTPQFQAVRGVQLLIIDEPCFVPPSNTGAELLFEVFSQRFERASTLATANLSFDKWT
jgi:hypothetical protein